MDTNTTPNECQRSSAGFVSTQLYAKKFTMSTLKSDAF